MDLPRGTRIGRWTIGHKIGQGASAVVYEVQDEHGTRCAAKVLTTPSSSLRERFTTEGRAQQRLDHPHVVATYDYLDHKGTPVLVMELVEGLDLHAWLRRHGPFGVEDGLVVFRGILDAVAHAHAAGMVHRDLKPTNVLLVERFSDGPPHPKVTDFGLVKDLGAQLGGRAKTVAGVGMGTPAYLSLEQLADASTVDLRTDIFSLGAILYEILVGRPAFQGTIREIMARVASEDYTPPSELVPDLPARVDRAIRRMLQPDADHRPRSCVEVESMVYGTRVLPSPALAARRSAQGARFDLARADTVLRLPGPAPVSVRETELIRHHDPRAIQLGLSRRQLMDAAMLVVLSVVFAAGVGIGVALMGF